MIILFMCSLFGDQKVVQGARDAQLAREPDKCFPLDEYTVQHGGFHVDMNTVQGILNYYKGLKAGAGLHHLAAYLNSGMLDKGHHLLGADLEPNLPPQRITYPFAVGYRRVDLDKLFTGNSKDYYVTRDFFEHVWAGYLMAAFRQFYGKPISSSETEWAGVSVKALIFAQVKF
jgi:hypothetical protein